VQDAGASSGQNHVFRCSRAENALNDDLLNLAKAFTARRITKVSEVSSGRATTIHTHNAKIFRVVNSVYLWHRY
jgi:hypothetical protein